MSKYIDIALIIFMGYFAYTRFVDEQYGFAAMFAALCLLNIVTTIVKHNKTKENAETK